MTYLITARKKGETVEIRRERAHEAALAVQAFRRRGWLVSVDEYSLNTKASRTVSRGRG